MKTALTIAAFILGTIWGMTINEVFSINLKKEKYLSIYHNNELFHLDVSNMAVATESGMHKVYLNTWEEFQSYVEYITVEETMDLKGLEIVPRLGNRDDVNVVMMYGMPIGILRNTARGMGMWIKWEEEDDITYSEDLKNIR